jgi:hypothetical protein
MILFWLAVGLVAAFGFVVFFGAPYVPSLHDEVRRSFDELYDVGPGDVVVDLGSGDGQVLVEAVRRGATGVGYELNPLLVMVSRLRLWRRAKVYLKDMWTARLPNEVTLVYAFTVSRDAAKLARRLQAETDRLNRPLAVMTFGATLPGIQPVEVRKGHTLYRFIPLQA